MNFFILIKYDNIIIFSKNQNNINKNVNNKDMYKKDEIYFIKILR